MAHDNERRVYWDSSVFLAYIDAETDRETADFLESILEASGDGRFQVVTSVLTVSEVAFTSAERSKLDPSIEEKLDLIWEDPVVRLADFHIGIARTARNLIRSAVAQQWTGLKGADAGHLATAMSLGVAEIHTFETRWPRYQELVGGIPIGSPTTLQAHRIRKPLE